MTAEPDAALTSSMLQRAGDLAHYMLTRDKTIAVASGDTPNGVACTVIMVIGEWSEAARDAGAKMVAEIVKRQQALGGPSLN